jgi:hypothetical protein
MGQQLLQMVIVVVEVVGREKVGVCKGSWQGEVAESRQCLVGIAWGTLLWLQIILGAIIVMGVVVVRVVVVLGAVMSQTVMRIMVAVVELLRWGTPFSTETMALLGGGSSLSNLLVGSPIRVCLIGEVGCL